MSAAARRAFGLPRLPAAAVTVALVAAVAAATATVGARGGLGPPATLRNGSLAAVVDAWQERSGAPAVLVAVDRPGQPLWTHAAGSTLRGGARPAPPDAPLRIASVTKPMVAVVVLQLVAEGRLGLDDPVADWLPSRAGLVRDATVRHLLAHRSGIPDYGGVPGFGDGLLDDRDRRWDTAELVALLRDVRPDFPAGSDFSYSNTGYVLLGMLIEAVTGRPWAEELRTRVLVPLDLRGTDVPSHDAPPAEVLPGYYDVDGDGFTENVETGPWPSLETSEGPAGAVVSTVADVTRFLRGLFDGALLPREQLDAMTEPGPHGRRYDGYGLGLEVTRPDRATLVLGHGGWVAGSRIVTWYVPDADAVITVAANEYRADPYDLAELLLHRVRADR